MKYPVRKGNYVIDAEPYFREAFSALKFINPKHQQSFCELFVKHDDGTFVRTIIKQGLPDDFCAETGELSVQDAVQAIALRVSRNLWRQYLKLCEEDLRSGPIFYYKRAECVSDEGCPAAAALHGQIVPLEDRCDFPLPECDRMWCNCEWDSIFERPTR